MMHLWIITYQTHAYDKPKENKQAAFTSEEAIRKYEEEGKMRKNITSIKKSKGGLIG